jgi:dynein heavy chain 1
MRCRLAAVPTLFVSRYVKVWLQYQALWDIQSDTIVNRLGEDLDKWQQLLVQIKKARKTFDTSDTTMEFGPVVINFSQVQTKVNFKYDQLHQDILNKFGMRMHTGMDDFFTTINKVGARACSVAHFLVVYRIA